MKKTAILFLHIGYWCLYLLLLVIIYGLMRIDKPVRLQPVGYACMMFAFTIVPGLLCFYMSYRFLFARFLTPKKIFQLAVALLAVAAVAGFAGDFVLIAIYGRRVLFNDGLSSAITITGVIALLGLIHGVTGLVMKGFISWYDDIKMKEELNKKNFDMELALMKAQINPHFLFNTINNIDVLIRKDPSRASEYLNKLSDMMRFMLYETKTEKIPLAKELGHIEKYVALQRIRSANPGYISYEVKGDPENLLIEPMLYTPFVENAFKHTEDKKADGSIHISFAIEKDKIKFECRNRFPAKPQLKPEYGGLGNELIRKRLELLYAGKYKLEVTNVNEVYTVKLELDIQ